MVHNAPLRRDGAACLHDGLGRKPEPPKAARQARQQESPTRRHLWPKHRKSCWVGFNPTTLCIQPTFCKRKSQYWLKPRNQPCLNSPFFCQVCCVFFSSSQTANFPQIQAQLATRLETKLRNVGPSPIPQKHVLSDLVKFIKIIRVLPTPLLEVCPTPPMQNMDNAIAELSP